MAWDKNQETDVIGYKIHYGIASKNYQYTVDVKNNTSCSISGLAEGTTYYFAATAYNGKNIESSHSEELAYTIPISPPPLSPTDTDGIGDIKITEDFERTDSTTVGNGWIEVESGASQTRVGGGKLVFDAADDSFRPLIYRSFPIQQAGLMMWSFDLNFQRTGSEKVYSFWMQLGQRSLMSDADPSHAGVAVNLKWGGPSVGLNTHEGLAYVLNGQVQQFATVSGIETVTVVADLDQQFYSVAVGQQQVLEIPFDNTVSIDTVRFFAHQLNRSNFALRELDNVTLQFTGAW